MIFTKNKESKDTMLTEAKGFGVNAQKQTHLHVIPFSKLCNNIKHCSGCCNGKLLQYTLSEHSLL